MRKYGQVIGVAMADIAPGRHVHVHNLAVSDLRADVHSAGAWSRSEPARSFAGYRRGNGRTGVRNYIGVLTSVNCSATVVRHIADAAERNGLLQGFGNIDGIVPITHASGCGMGGEGEGFDILRRTLWGTAANPNFAAILLVGLGCETIQIDRLKKNYGIADGGSFQSFTIQDSGGTRRAIAEGLDRLKALLPAANAFTRSEVPASELVLGLQCGGSDAWSGITSNPALGDASDRLVALGGTVILSETPEIYGAEHLLYARAKSPAVSAKLRGATGLVGELHPPPRRGDEQQSLARQQGRRADHHSGEVAGRGRQERRLAAQRRDRIRRAHPRARPHFHGQPGVSIPARRPARSPRAPR